MCGIFGMVAKYNVIEKTIEGLKKLEYRGYDSSGIAFTNDDEVVVIKKIGEIKNLDNSLKEHDYTSNCAISHTRWATHGKPSDSNSHPHYSELKEFTLVHNGIIENYLELKEKYLQGVNLTSDTDTEIIAHLINKFYKGNILESIKLACDEIKGSYAFAIISKHDKNKIYCTKKDSPLVVAAGDNESYISSDSMPILKYTNKQYVVNNYEYCVVENNNIVFFDRNLNKIEKEYIEILDLNNDVELGKYPHFMIKEINEIPTSVVSTIKQYSSLTEVFKDVPKSVFKDVEFIKIIACGTAYHAGRVGKKFIEDLTDIKVDVEIASEFRYSKVKFLKNTLCIFISQSGETADTIAALKLCKHLGVPTLSIVNVKNSSITYESDYCIYTMAGREIAVASTKAYNCQIAMLMLLTGVINAVKLNNDEHFYGVINEIENIFKQNPKLIDEILNKTLSLGEKYKEVKSIYLIGRQQDYLTAIESALKLKEISYIHCEAYPAGELKHGTISLIEDGTLVICFITQEHINEKTLNGIHEVKSRGAEVLLITTLDFDYDKSVYSEIIRLPFVKEDYSCLISVIPSQVLAYNISKNLGYNPDKPRNLAKSVTVE